MGWPKGCKTNGHRVGVVPNQRVTSLGYSLGNARTKGRPTVNNVSKCRSYSTGGTNNVANAIDSLARHCSERPDKVVDRKLLKMLSSEGFLIIAYYKIKVDCSELASERARSASASRGGLILLRN